MMQKKYQICTQNVFHSIYAKLNQSTFLHQIFRVPLFLYHSRLSEYVSAK